MLGILAFLLVLDEVNWGDAVDEWIWFDWGNMQDSGLLRVGYEGETVYGQRRSSFIKEGM